MEVRLHELGLQYGTDKATLHGYCETYEQYLSRIRNAVTAVLEVGIAGGASLRMWHDYFPNATIYGIDHNPEYVKAFETDSRRIMAVQGEAGDGIVWNKFNHLLGTFDLVIDDGSHTTANMIRTFGFAFPLLRSGGLYVVEDSHAAYLPEYNRDNALVGGIKNAVEYFLQLVHQVNEHGDKECGRQTWSNYESIHFHKSLVIIRKR